MLTRLPDECRAAKGCARLGCRLRLCEVTRERAANERQEQRCLEAAQRHNLKTVHGQQAAPREGGSRFRPPFGNAARQPGIAGIRKPDFVPD